MSQITGRDIIAVVLLAGAFTLRGLGIDSLTEWLIIGVAAGYGLWSAGGHLRTIVITRSNSGETK